MSEPSTDEREALGRVLFLADYPDLPEAIEWWDLPSKVDHELWLVQADAAEAWFATRPAVDVEAIARVLAGVHGCRFTVGINGETIKSGICHDCTHQAQGVVAYLAGEHRG